MYAAKSPCSQSPLEPGTWYLFHVQRDSFFGKISWWVTNWAVQLISIVSLSLQDYTNFHLDRETTSFEAAIWIDFCALIIKFFFPFLRLQAEAWRIWGKQISPKFCNFEFSWISRRERVWFSNCLDLHIYNIPGTRYVLLLNCSRVSASNYQVLIFSS